MKRIFIVTLFLAFTAVAAFSQNVGIGTNSPAAILDVNSSINLTSRFNGPNQMYLGFFETNILRGYLGSFSGAAEDFDMGTSSGNATGKLHLTTQAIPKLTIDNTGNVGIGTTSPSALLDISSTTKGILIPRMTTAQRTAIASPVAGLMVYDNTTNSFWYYNGSSWLNMSGGGGFSLPYAANVNIAGPVFQIENSGNGDVLYIGNLGSGGGLNTYTISGDAINANSVSGYGMRTTSSTNYALLAFSDNAANTLAAIRAINIGGGVGLHASSTADNGILGTSSVAGKAGIRGEATGTGGNGVYGTTTSSAGAGVSGFNANGAGVLGTSTTNYGVRGVVTNSASGTIAGVYGGNTGTAGVGVYGIADFASGAGVYGTSAAGTGVGAFSGSNRAVSALSNSGTALYGNSSTGYALETAGNVKIAGGNTNPAAGAVLTSDASGNAVWKKNRVAFSVNGVASDYISVPDESEWKVLFANESYDYGNNFENYTAGVPTAEDGTFLVPVTGVYHFDVKLLLAGAAFTDIERCRVRLMLQRGVSIVTLAEADGTIMFNPSLTDDAMLKLNNDIRLVAGDRVWVSVYHESDTGDSAILSGGSSFTLINTFSGHLVFEE